MFTPVFRITCLSDRPDDLPTNGGFADPFGPDAPDLSLAGDRPCPAQGLANCWENPDELFAYEPYRRNSKNTHVTIGDLRFCCLPDRWQFVCRRTMKCGPTSGPNGTMWSTCVERKPLIDMEEWSACEDLINP